MSDMHELLVIGALFVCTMLVIAVGLALFKELADEGIRHDSDDVPPSW
jgi:hypothetical protein